ncbi:MAG: lipoprotein signal peptidase [Mediterranea massiliensis]|nr:lipoprotein signal peptidase [Mediterranea massiliensis]
MNKYLTKGRIALLIIFSVLVIDQLIKVWVKTTMFFHQSENVFKWIYDKLGIDAEPPTWFYILFTENNGMAFGMEIIGKFFLTSFRIVAVIVIGYFLYKFIKYGLKTGFIVCISLILAGAVGNIIDCVFYGVLFNESTHYQIASFMPEGGGYAPWFYGKVVDMFYFPIIDSYWPNWMPWVGGEHFIFFSPIFNFADAAISCGIVALFLFYGRYLNDSYQLIKKNN